VAQKRYPHVPKFTLKTLPRDNEGTLAQNHLILSQVPHVTLCDARGQFAGVF